MVAHEGPGKPNAAQPDRRGRMGLLRQRVPKPRRRFRAGRLLAALHQASEALQVALEPEIAAWAALVTLTAGEGFGFNRAFLLLAEGDRMEGRFALGPRSREEAARIWAELGRQRFDPLAGLARPNRETIEHEQLVHATTLARLSHPLERASWRRGFVGRAGHPSPCVGHWIGVLESPALAVVPMMAGDRPWGVLLADNFVTGFPIYPGTIEAATTLGNALRVALERTNLLRSLQEEQSRRLGAEHATALLEAARTLAHDLTNPLALAGGLAAELIARPPANRAILRRELATVRNAVQTAEERVTQLVERLASHAEGVTLEPVDVGEVTAQVVASFYSLAVTRQVHLIYCLPGPEAVARAERSYLARCVENLLGNALQALRERHATGDGVVRVAVHTQGPEVRLEVADNGRPLPPSLRADPFSADAATSRAGAGLGLVSVRRLAEAMGGRVEYDESEPGWVRFTVVLRR
ncbi:MAG: HAMP domain-containing sensor histidine kinase [Acidobacteriota bacterium]